MAIAGLIVKGPTRSFRSDTDALTHFAYSGPSVVYAAEIAVCALAGFELVHPNLGESRTLTVHLAPRRFQHWPVVAGEWKAVQGNRTIEVGSSELELRLRSGIRFRRM